jgi:histidinol-phosphate aminotransferase
MPKNGLAGRATLPESAGSALRAIRHEVLGIDRYTPPFADRSLVNLSLNEHYAPPSSRVLDALRDIDPLRLVSYDIELTEKLRYRIAEREGVSIANVLLSTGSSSALQLLFSCLVDGVVLLPSTSWSYYLSLARLRGLRVKTYDVTRGSDEFLVDPASVSDAVRRYEPTLAVFINPHMPTGALVDAGAIAAIAAERPETLVLADEAYHGFSPRAESLASAVPFHPNLIVSKTFSKFFGLAGIRMGYLVAHENIIDELSKAAPPFSVPFVSALLALAALDSESYYRDLAIELMAVKESFAAGISRLPGVRAYQSHANFLLTEFESAERAHQAGSDVQAAGFTVRSASSYGMPRFLRITVGTAEAMEYVTSAVEKGAAPHAAA